MKIIASVMILLLSAACAGTATTTTPTGRPSGGGACGAAEYASNVGGPLGDLRYPPAQEARLINPGEMVTLEYNPDRLNIEIDKAGRIVALTCG